MLVRRGIDSHILIPGIGILVRSFVGGVTYSARVLATQAANLQQYLTLGDASGATAADSSGNGRTGSYANVTLGETGIGDGLTAALFGGSNSSVYVPYLQTSAPANAGTYVLWAKVYNVGVWSDATKRSALAARTNANNIMDITKQGTAGRFEIAGKRGGTAHLGRWNSQTTTAWVCWIVTWSEGANEVEQWKDGVKNSTDACGNWSGVVNSDYSHLGIYRYSTNLSPWHGWLAHFATWDVVLTDAEIIALSTV